VASWAIRYTVSLDNVMVVLSGMSNQAQLLDNMSYMHKFKPLTKEEQDIINKVAVIIKGGTIIPCTACRYCVDTCPQKIAIPEYFSAYNNLKQFASQNIVAATYYSNIAQRNGKASDCSLCGTCEEHCPQHLPIREYLKDVAVALE
jgi:predicted aldo/keto reductase-like oxidoreductase